MPPQIPKDRHHAFLVVRHGQGFSVHELMETFNNAPPLADALIRPYYDAVTGTMLFHLTHRADEVARSGFRVWARIEGIGLVEQRLSQAEQQLMLSELEPYDCRRPANQEQRSVWSLACELAAACRRAPSFFFDGDADQATCTSELAPVVHGTIELESTEPSNEWDSVELSPSLIRELGAVETSAPKAVEVSTSMSVHIRRVDTRAETVPNKNWRSWHKQVA